MAEQSIVPQRPNDELNLMLKACVTPSEATLVTELYLTAANAKTQLDPHLSRELLREFAGQSAEALRWAFHEWRSQSPFQPAISDIWALLARYHENRRLEAAEDQRKRDKEEIDRRIAAGDRLVTREELSAMLKAVVRRMDEIPAARRAELHEQIRSTQTRKPEKRNVKERRPATTRKRSRSGA